MQLDARWLIAPFVCLWPLAAAADGSNAAKVISECGAPDLPQASLDSCLERVRVLEETEPSSGLQALEASLEQRESAGPPGTRTASAPAPMTEVAPEPDLAATGDEVRDESASRRAEPNNSAPRSGPSVEDEPPVADAPEVPSSDPAADDTDGPPQS